MNPKKNHYLPSRKGSHHTEETKQLLREKRKLQKIVHTEETKRKISKANKGRILSEEWRKKIGERHKGIKLTKEHKKNISRALKGKIVTEKTRNKMSIAQKDKPHPYAVGEKNWSWEGGITPLNKKIRHSIEYRLWREAVFARDNWICQKCGKRGRILHPHHIQNFSKYPQLRFAIDNGITLCKICHIQFHKIYGKKYNEKEQIKNYLST